MNEQLPFAAGLLAATLALTTTAQAQVRALDAAAAESLALERHPLLCAASHDTRQRLAAADEEEDRRAWTLGADAGATHQRLPTLAVGGVTTPTTDAVTLGADVDKTFAFGTRLGARVETRYQRSSIPIAPGASQQLTLGPGYGATARLSLEQPLWRGAGTDLGEAELRARRAEARGARSDRGQLARDIRRDARLGYYELWLAGEALAIERQARDLAERELRDAQARLDAGATATTALVAPTTRLAEREEAVVAAELRLRQQGLVLGKRLGDARGLTFVAAEAPPSPPLIGERSPEPVVRRAWERSAALKALDARADAARARMRLAGEGARPALDLSGWVQADGLGLSPGPALEQLGTLGAVSAQVGLRFEAPVSGDARGAAQRAAQAALDALTSRREALRQELAAVARRLVAQETAARRRLSLARRTVAAAHEELQAVRGHLAAGQGVAIEVQRASDALRWARLRVAELRVEWAAADAAIDELIGARPVPAKICSRQ